MTEADEATLEIGEAIIQNLDEDGLLRVSLETSRRWGRGRWKRWRGR